MSGYYQIPISGRGWLHGAPSIRPQCSHATRVKQFLPYGIQSNCRRLSAAFHQGVRRAGILAYAFLHFILSILLRGQRFGSLSGRFDWVHLGSIGWIHPKDLYGTDVVRVVSERKHLCDQYRTLGIIEDRERDRYKHILNIKTFSDTELTPRISPVNINPLKKDLARPTITQA